jgi:hypothetical protein
MNLNGSLAQFLVINSESAFKQGPITVAARSKARTVFARSEAGIVGTNPTQGMDIWYVCVFILKLCEYFSSYSQ